MPGPTTGRRTPTDDENDRAPLALRRGRGEGAGTSSGLDGRMSPEWPSPFTPFSAARRLGRPLEVSGEPSSEVSPARAASTSGEAGMASASVAAAETVASGASGALATGTAGVDGGTSDHGPEVVSPTSQPVVTV